MKLFKHFLKRYLKLNLPEYFKGASYFSKLNINRLHSLLYDFAFTYYFTMFLSYAFYYFELLNIY